MASDVVSIKHRETGATAEILVSLGFNCYSWKMPIEGESEPMRELLWADPNYSSGECGPAESGIPLLFPFPGRIAKGEFIFEGKEYKLPVEADGNALHGYAFKNAWRVVDQQEDQVTAEFQPSIDAPHVLDLWTGDYLLKATYKIEADKLLFDFEAENIGDQNLPFGFGTHAYFRLPMAEGSDGENTLAHAPINGVWETEGLIPTGDCTAIDNSYPLAGGTAIDGAEYDTPFRLTPGENEEIVTTLTDESSGRQFVQTFDRSMVSCVVYLPPHREAICLEPYTCVPDPFNLEGKGIDAGMRILPPGESYKTKASYKFKLG